MYLDSARKFLESRDTSAAARMFGLAAPILREHATLSTSTAQDPLRTSAGELDSLAAAIRAGQVVTSDAYTSVLIRLNLTEAEHHRSLAAAALVAGDTMLAGEELVMSADHFDRALRDRGPVPSQIATLIDEALKLGTAMHRAEAFAASDVDARLTALGRSIQTARAGGPVISK
jgi:hypothetical protein